MIADPEAPFAVYSVDDNIIMRLIECVNDDFDEKHRKQYRKNRHRKIKQTGSICTVFRIISGFPLYALISFLQYLRKAAAIPAAVKIIPGIRYSISIAPEETIEVPSA